MHELGIVTHLAKTLDEIAEEEKISSYGSVTLEVGEVPCIMTDYFVDCWDYFKRRHEKLQECKLIIEEEKAVTICTACNQEYETVKYGKICPYCNSPETYLLRGNGCVIKQVEAETEE
jgi:hydrogenase nickel incorporation protein HypA/HybF